VSPASGSTAGGGQVTVTGTNLTGATAVRFGSTAAAGFTVTDDGHVTATAPAGAATTVDVTVTTAGGTSATGTADHYRYLRRPHVTSLSHGSGRRTGGAKVVVIGTGFRPGAVVRFGRTRAATVTVKSSTRIVVRAPRHARGTVDVVVATGGGSSPRVRRDRFRYV
jgi:hypothetical protein